MDIQKIKELALANGFKLKEQADGSMDLNAYVYDFANAIEQAAKAHEAEKLKGCVMDIENNSIVTDVDTQVLDSQIAEISNEFAETYYCDEEDLEMLVAKAMKLGELYERKKWQAAKAHEAKNLEGCVVVPVEPTAEMIEAGNLANECGSWPHEIYAVMIEAARGGK